MGRQYFSFSMINRDTDEIEYSVTGFAEEGCKERVRSEMNYIHENKHSLSDGNFVMSRYSKNSNNGIKRSIIEWYNN